MLLPAIFFLLVAASAQSQNKTSLNGYVKYLQTIVLTGEDSVGALFDNLVHNRLNFNWYINDNFTFHTGMRNRIFYGDLVRNIDGYDELVAADPGALDLSFNWISKNDYFINTTFDRLYIDYTGGKWQARLGRQRINWGQNFIWNANDVFNAFSYFDFDYEERPGTDALRIQYYQSYTNTAEFVYQYNDDIDEMSFVGKYQFNTNNYDIQFLGGKVFKDAFLGMGWAGDIKGGGFRGEISWFHGPDMPGEQKNSSQVVASLSGDYTFKSSLYLHGAMIYNSKGSKDDISFGSFSLLSPLSAKFLTFSRMELFFQSSYQISPLTRGDIAGIVNPFDGSFFVGPSVSHSLMDNLELFFIGQFFGGRENTLYGSNPHLLYWRLKWSF